MRYLFLIAIVVGSCSAAALLLVDFSHVVGQRPTSAIAIEMTQRKLERTHDFYGNGLIAALACAGLASFIGVGKRWFTSQSPAGSDPTGALPQSDSIQQF